MTGASPTHVWRDDEGTCTSRQCQNRSPESSTVPCPLSPRVPMKARPPAPLACSTAQTNKRVTLVCQLGTVFAMFWPYYDCIQRLFSTAVRSRNFSNAQNIALLCVLRRSSNIAAPVRVLVAFLWTLLFSVFVLCSVYARLSKNE